MGTSEAIEQFLTSGEFDPRFPDWAGDAVKRREAGTTAMRDVLRRVLAWRARRAPRAVGGTPSKAKARIRARMEPLVRGMFEAEEAERLLEVLPSRVRIVTPERFETLVDEVSLRTAWDLANLLLDDLCAPPLSDDAPTLEGLCDGRRAWVLPSALEATEPFPDVVVHEAAHLLHSVPRTEVGLEGAGPILQVPRRRWETFAWACELWAAGEGSGAASTVTDGRVDVAELRRVLEAAEGGEGWGALRRWGRRGKA